MDFKQVNISSKTEPPNIKQIQSTPFISNMMINPSFVPKTLFKFHKTVTTDDERFTMLERFRKEGLDARKLNDSKKLLHVWRWLVDAEINCQSLRYQLEKLRIQQEQELEGIEDYVAQVWKLSMERVSALQEENQLLYLKLNNNQVKLSDKSFPINDINNNKNCSKFNNDYLKKDLLPKAVKVRSITPKYHPNLNSPLLSALSPTSNIYNVIDVKKISNYPSNLNLIKRSMSCNGLDNLQESKRINCFQCIKLETKLNKLKQQFDSVCEHMEKIKEQNFVMKKLNRCFEIENETYAYKLTESESESNQLEQRVITLEKELKRRKNSDMGHLDSETLVINQQKRLIDELNEKIKYLEETLDSKQMILEFVQSKQMKQLNSHQCFRKSDHNNNKSNSDIANEYQNFQLSDEFEEILLS